VFPLVFLGDTSDRQECVGRGSNKEFLEVFDFPPCLIRGGSVDTLLQLSYIPFHRTPLDVSPRCIGVFHSPFDEWFHRLTSPRMRTLSEFPAVRTKRKSAPCRAGYVHFCGPIRPVTGRRSLFPSSHTLCSIPLPCGRDTTDVGSIGLTQLSMKKSVDRSGWSLYPGGRAGCRRSQNPEAVLPTYHFGCGLSASLATSRSRGFMMTLHLRSTLPSFPSLFPRRGWQKPEHCSQSFVPQITRQHVWVGTPGHHGARSGSLSPYSILLHRPYEVSQEYACSPPGHSAVNGEDSSDSWACVSQDHALHGWGFLFRLEVLAALKPDRGSCGVQGSLDSGVAPPESGDGHWDNAQSHIKSQEQA